VGLEIGMGDLDISILIINQFVLLLREGTSHHQSKRPPKTIHPVGECGYIKSGGSAERFLALAIGPRQPSLTGGSFDTSVRTQTRRQPIQRPACGRGGIPTLAAQTRFWPKHLSCQPNKNVNWGRPLEDVGIARRKKLLFGTTR